MNYQHVKLGEICDFLYGRGLPETQRKSGAIPVYGSNGIVGWHDQAVTKGQTIIIGRKGSIGEVHFSKLPCWPIDTTYYLEATKKPCDLSWLYYMLVALDLTQLNKSAAIPGLNRDDAYGKEIPFPKPSEQKRISTILEKADRLRRQHHYALELSNTYLQSVFGKMFKEANHKFKIVTIEDIASQERHALSSGPFGSNLISVHYTQKGVVVLRGLNISDGELNLDDVKYVSEEKAQELSRSEVNPGDIVVVAVGSSGFACQIPHTLPRAIMSQNFNKVTPDLSKIDPNFLEYLINSQIVQQQFRQEITDTVRTFLSLTKLKTVKIPLPPLPLQQKFAQIVQKFERLRTQQREAERQAEHLFQTLLHQAFQGNIDLGPEIAQDISVKQSVQPSVVDSELTDHYVQLQLNY